MWKSLPPILITTAAPSFLPSCNKSPTRPNRTGGTTGKGVVDYPKHNLPVVSPQSHQPQCRGQATGRNVCPAERPFHRLPCPHNSAKRGRRAGQAMDANALVNGQRYPPSPGPYHIIVMNSGETARKNGRPFPANTKPRRPAPTPCQPIRKGGTTGIGIVK